MRDHSIAFLRATLTDQLALMQVRADAIATALHDETGKLTLRGHADRLGVSRLHAHRSRPM